MSPPVFGEYFVLAGLAHFTRALVVLTAQLSGVRAWLGPRGQRCERATGRARCGASRCCVVSSGRGGIRGSGLSSGCRCSGRRGCGSSAFSGRRRGFWLRFRERRGDQKTERNERGNGGLFHADLRYLPGGRRGVSHARRKTVNRAARSFRKPGFAAYLRNAAMMSVPTCAACCPSSGAGISSSDMVLATSESCCWSAQPGLRGRPKALRKVSPSSMAEP